MSWDYLFVQAANGAVVGVIYALIAVGVTLIFSILKIVNFAHGDLYMLGGYCAYYVIEYLGVPPLGAMVVSMALRSDTRTEIWPVAWMPSSPARSSSRSPRVRSSAFSPAASSATRSAAVMPSLSRT